MNYFIYLISFLSFCWALFATIFAYQLNKENEDFARRLGRNVSIQKFSFSEYLTQLKNKEASTYTSIYSKIKYDILGADKILKLFPLKIKFK